jgi:hypothetical protein
MAIIIPILSQFDERGIKKAVREFEKAKGAFNKTTVAVGYVGQSMTNLGQNLTRTVTPAMIGLGVGIYKAVQAASTLSESISKTNAVFKENATVVQKWAKTTSAAFGVSEQAALEAAGTYGNLFQAFGLSNTSATKMSMTLVELAADMASFNNVPIADALQALRSGLAGETEPLKRFGVALNEVRLKEEAMRLGLITTTSGTLPIAIKAQAAYALILKDTALQQGDVARTSGGLANQQKFLGAQVQDLTAQFGMVFVPIMLEVVAVIRDQIMPRIAGFIEALQKLSPEAVKTGVKIGLLITIIGPLLIALGAVIRTVLLLSQVFLILQKSILRIPLAIALLVGMFAVQNDAQYKLAKETGDSWTMITKIIIAGVRAILFAIDRVIDGFKFIGFTLDYASARVDNFFDTLVGRGRSMMSFEQMMEGFQFSDLAGGLDSLVVGLKDFNDEIKTAGKDAANMAAEAAKLQMEVDGLTAGLTEETNPAMEKLADKASKAKEALKKMKEAAKDAAQAVVDNLEASLSSAESKLEDAKNAFMGFKNGIMDSVKGVVSFGKAIEEGDFFKNLTDQAASATNFAGKVQKLIALGLSERGIQQVLDAGFEAGTKIADEIISGGATMVQQINTLVSAVDIVAEQVGDYGADVFYGEGVRQGESLVAGIKAALLAAQAELKSIVDSLGTGETTTTTGPGAPTPKVEKKPKAKATLDLSRLTATATKAIANLPGPAARSYTALAQAYGLTKFAKGGIVMGPTNALIGEAGPEAVIPLSGANSSGLGNTFNITINAGIGTDGNVVGRQIVDAIKRFEKTSGPVFASA